MRSLPGIFIYVELLYYVRCRFIEMLPEGRMRAPEIITYHKYPIEIHHVTTEDGYILEMHRIPHGKNESQYDDNGGKTIIFLQHGFIGSSAVWVTNTPNESAAFIFADAGFDVWMGNVRGNTYSRNHVSLTRFNKRYWEFTFDEFAKYDLPAMIDYVLNKTGKYSLNYMGYSEGTLTMFARLSTDPQFAKKISKFFALGPIGTLTHIKGLLKIAAKHFMQALKLLVKLGGEFMPNASLFQKLSRSTCSLRSIVEYCQNLMFQITGPDTSQMNQTRIPVYMSHLPAGTSIANLMHWAQMVNSQRIEMYDYGSTNKNIKHYNKSTPPVYDLSKVNAPLYLYWSDKDWLADKLDIEETLLTEIPKQYLVENNRLANFNHFDFIWGVQAARLIYNPIVNTITAGERTVHLVEDSGPWQKFIRRFFKWL